MRVILFQTEDFLILSYPAMLLLAVVAALVTLAWRIRRTSLDHSAVLIPLVVAVLIGWLGSRLAAGLINGNSGGFSFRLLLPTEHVPGSFSIFIAIALPILLLGLWHQRTGVWVCLDVLAPSALAALAVAKVGCLLAGCCAGAECPADWGIRYPYGSRPYAMQVEAGRITPPQALLRTDEHGNARLFGHVDFLEGVRHAPHEELAKHAEEYGLTYSEMVALAESERSAPVWPVPVFYTISSGILWLLAEIIFARSSRAGWTSATVLIAYAVMRLAFDPFLSEPLRAGTGMVLARTAALMSLVGGVGLVILCMLGRTPETRGKESKESTRYADAQRTPRQGVRDDL